MFESVALGRKYPKKEFADIEPELRTALFRAQRTAIEKKIPVIILIDGVETAGRGETVNMLSEWMDEKAVRNHTFWLETDEEKKRPYAWRFWRTLPAGGTVGVYFGGWYGNEIRSFKKDAAENEENFEKIMRRWARFEKTLTSSGTALIKIWLHINKHTFKKRIKERLKDDKIKTFSPCDVTDSEGYDALLSAAAKAIRITDRENAPWTLVDAEDDNYRNAAVARAVTAAIEKTASEIDKNRKKVARAASACETSAITALDRIDLSKQIDHDEYKEELKRLSRSLNDLTYKAYKKGISSTLVFEGWDAAGKGGAIRRLTHAVDARITRVIPVSAPNDEELARNYLWRFWMHVPMAGFVTIYDRSWYGRVLVERVDGLAPESEWSRGYSEINDFEEQLTENGNILLKFWLHISPEEQLKRFKDREETPWKNYKITPDDWHNRSKREEYLLAADEMFARTDTDVAPWHIIPAEDKKYARISIIKIYEKALENALKNFKTGK